MACDWFGLHIWLLILVLVSDRHSFIRDSRLVGVGGDQFVSADHGAGLALLVKDYDGCASMNPAEQHGHLRFDRFIRVAVNRALARDELLKHRCQRFGCELVVGNDSHATATAYPPAPMRPSQMPMAKTIPPPTITCTTVVASGVFMNL